MSGVPSAKCQVPSGQYCKAHSLRNPPGRLPAGALAGTSWSHAADAQIASVMPRMRQLLYELHLTASSIILRMMLTMTLLLSLLVLMDFPLAKWLICQINPSCPVANVFLPERLLVRLC